MGILLGEEKKERTVYNTYVSRGTHTATLKHISLRKWKCRKQKTKKYKRKGKQQEKRNKKMAGFALSW